MQRTTNTCAPQSLILRVVFGLKKPQPVTKFIHLSPYDFVLFCNFINLPNGNSKYDRNNGKGKKPTTEPFENQAKAKPATRKTPEHYLGVSSLQLSAGSLQLHQQSLVLLYQLSIFFRQQSQLGSQRFVFVFSPSKVRVTLKIATILQHGGLCITMNNTKKNFCCCICLHVTKLDTCSLTNTRVFMTGLCRLNSNASV